MAARKMTFSIPDSLASEFLKSDPARERSNYVAEAVAARLRKQDDALIRACEIANRDVDLLAIEREFEVIGGDIAEPWINASKG
jgi:stage V sporulation protein SpoVS